MPGTYVGPYTVLASDWSSSEHVTRVIGCLARGEPDWSVHRVRGGEAGNWGTCHTRDEGDPVQDSHHPLHVTRYSGVADTWGGEGGREGGDGGRERGGKRWREGRDGGREGGGDGGEGRDGGRERGGKG